MPHLAGILLWVNLVAGDDRYPNADELLQALGQYRREIYWPHVFVSERRWF